MNQPDDSEYEIQEPKQLEPKRIEPKQNESEANPHFEDEYSLEDTGAFRGETWSWATRAIGLLLATLTLNGLMSYFVFSIPIFWFPSYLHDLIRFVSFVYLGLFVCQYGAIWVWLKLHLSGWLIRAVLGSLIVTAVSVSGLISEFIQILSTGRNFGNPWPEVMILLCVLLWWAGVYYLLHSMVLGLLLERTRLTLVSRVQGGNQYLILGLLGWMMVFGIASVVLEYVAALGISREIGYIALCMMMIVLTAFLSALVIYTQFASRFALERRKFRAYWWILVVIAPPIYLGCAESLFKIFVPTMPPVGIRNGLAFTYFAEVGLVLGTWIQLKLIPKRGF